jgi:hypothetical protein
MNSIIKIVLAVFLVICLADMPYGYYQFVRFLALMGFSYLAYSASTQNKSDEALIFVALAILFQPLLKISLGRTLWNIVDVVVAIGLIISSLKILKQKKKL